MVTLLDHCVGTWGPNRVISLDYLAVALTECYKLVNYEEKELFAIVMEVPKWIICILESPLDAGDF